MGKGFAAVALLGLFVLSALAASCGGDGDAGPNVDIKDFDTARFTMTQTSGGQQGWGEGVIDNRKQALSVAYDSGAQMIAIGRTTYRSIAGRWVSSTEPADGLVGFGRPYWPQFWRDAVDVVPLVEVNREGQEQQDSETTGYRLTFDPDEVEKHLPPATGGAERRVTQAEVDVWVDNDSRYAVELTVRLEWLVGGASGRAEMTSYFSDFGTEVQIEAPEGPAPTVLPPTESPPTEPAPTEPVTLGQG